MTKLTIEEYADRLASNEPAPGGGSAAALSGVLGSSLLEMAIRLTIGKPDCKEAAALTHHLEQVTKARRQLLHLVDKDAEVFTQVIAAYKMPKGPDDDRAMRLEAIQASLRLAAEVPLETARACLGALETAKQLLGQIHPEVVSDLMVGAANLEAGVTGALLNTAINLPLLKDESFVKALAGQVHLFRISTEELMREIRERVYNEDTFNIMQV